MRTRLTDNQRQQLLWLIDAEIMGPASSRNFLGVDLVELRRLLEGVDTVVEVEKPGGD